MQRYLNISLLPQTVLTAPARWQVSALFGELPGGKERIIATADELEKLRWTIKRNLACGGGLLVLEFEEIPGTHSPQPR